MKFNINPAFRMSLRSVSTSVSASTSFQSPRWEQTSELSDGLPLTIEVANACSSTIKLPNLKVPVVFTVNGSSTRLPSITKGDYTCRFYVSECPRVSFSSGSGGNNTQTYCVYRGDTVITMALSGPTNISVDVYYRRGNDHQQAAPSPSACEAASEALSKQCEATAEAFCKNPLTIVIDLAK